MSAFVMTKAPSVPLSAHAPHLDPLSILYVAPCPFLIPVVAKNKINIIKYNKTTPQVVAEPTSVIHTLGPQALP